MDFTNIAGIAVIGSIVAFWSQIKGWLSSVGSLVVRTDTFKTVYEQRLVQHLLDNGKIIRWGNASYAYYATFTLSSNLKRKADVFNREERSLFVLYKGFIPIIISYSGFLKVTYIYGTIDLKSIIDDIFREIQNTEEWIPNGSSCFCVLERYGATRSNELSSLGAAHIETKRGENPCDSTIIPFRLMNGHGVYVGIKESDIVYGYKAKNERFYWSAESLMFRNELDFFVKKRNWFYSKGLSHFRGALIFGPPGTGKSLSVLESARYVDVMLEKLNIANMSGEEFATFFKGNRGIARIILIEDVDAVFDGRKNILAESSLSKNLLSFDVFINTISDIASNDGAFLVLTTNHPEKLDPALVRAGRCDVKIEMGYLDEAGKRFIAKNILSDWPEMEATTVNEFIGQDITAARYECICVERAREKIFSENRPLITS